MAKFDNIPGAGRFSNDKLMKVYRRGLGAYYSSGSRPGVSAHQWAMGRVKSFVSGKGGARKADADILKGDNPRRASFLARMGGMPGPERDAQGKPTRLLLSLRAWGASSKADAKSKAAAISKRNKAKKSA